MLGTRWFIRDLPLVPLVCRVVALPLLLVRRRRRRRRPAIRGWMCWLVGLDLAVDSRYLVESS
jgi:hypothetical protein